MLSFRSTLPYARLVAGLVSLSTALLSFQAFRRWLTFHNHTFDLAMYARMAWGYAHANLWDPFVSAWFWGVHLSPVLLPLGILGTLFDVVPVLLIAQAAIVSLTAWPLAKLAAHRFGGWAAPVTAMVWLLHPNLGHVVTDEFHPGTLAVLPMAWAAYALDQRASQMFKWSIIAILCCREDFALVTFLFGCLAMRTESLELRALGKKIALYSLIYFALFSLVMLPLFGPHHGSLSLHFGQWGTSLPHVAWYLITHPLELWTHLSASSRAWYIPSVALTVGLVFPWLRPQWLILALPTFAINFLSEFPGVTRLDSHYLTPALPFIVIAAIDGAHVVSQRLAHAAKPLWVSLKSLPLILVFGASITTHVLFGGMPWSHDYQATDFRVDARSFHARQALTLVSSDASVQAPDALLSHLAERDRVHRGPPPDMNTKFVLLDMAYRQHYTSDGTVLRTAQDPSTRDWLSRSDYVLRFANLDFAVLEHGPQARTGPYAATYILKRNVPAHGVALTSCLSAVNATLKNNTLLLKLYAHAPCPSDLALRIGHERKPPNVVLPFDGLFSPAHLRRGDLAETRHVLTQAQALAIRTHGLRIGTIRSSGARPEPSDPDAVDVPLLKGTSQTP